MKRKFNYLTKSALLLLAFVAMSGFASAQRTISGMIKDADNREPLIGASVLAEGTTTGTVTDFDGKFSLNVPSSAKALVISYTGYNTQRVELGASNNVDISLKGGTVLDQVVVVGYGSLKAKQVTSAVTSVKAEEFNKGNINDPIQLLQGKVAGLNIARASGDPNGAFEIRLRGISTIGANVQPLVVVDGIPGVDIKLVDPNDIEQIDVLKDGSASAIYGARASSGVILITTKKGASGRTLVEYNTQFTKDNIARLPQIMTAEQYKAAKGDTIRKDVATDWYKEITNPDAFSQIHNLSLSGGIGQTSYRASFNYRGARGIMQNDGFNQLNARLNVTQKALDDKLTFTVDASATNRDSKFGFAEAFRYATIYNPTAPIFDSSATRGAPYGGYYQVTGFEQFNPVALVNQSINEGNQKRININGKVAYEVMRGLTASATYGLTRRSDVYGQYYSRLGLFRGGAGGAQKGAASRFTEDEVANFFNTTLEYKNNYGKLGFNVIGGYEYSDQLLSNFAINNAKGFATDLLKYNNIESAENILLGQVKPESAKNGRKLASFFGRVALDYDDTYFAQIALRQDGSSMLSAGNKWGLFPAISAGVALHKLANIKSFQNLKLRAGYGVTGALPGDPYLSLTTYRPVPVSGSTPGTVGTSFDPDRNGNPDLKWEQKAEFNVGLDFLTLNSRLSGSLEYYSRNITDLLYFFQNTPAGLFEKDGITANGGELTSSGVEATLNFQVIKPTKKDGFSWNTGINAGTAQTVLNKIATDKFSIGAAGYLKLANVGGPGLNDDFITLVTSGQQLGRLMAFDYVGVDSAGSPQGRSKSGEVKLLKDLTDGDRIEAGNGLPKLNLGWSNQIQVAGFDLNFFFRAVLGHSLVNEYRVFYENNNAGSIKSYNRIQTKYWDPKIKQASYNSYYVEKADFLRLDNLTLGYTFKMPAGSSISKLRLYVTGNNLLTVTNYTGVDPEVRYSDVGASANGDTAPRQFNPDPLVPGVDRRTNYFSVRSFSVGLNVGF